MHSACHNKWSDRLIVPNWSHRVHSCPTGLKESHASEKLSFLQHATSGGLTDCSCPTGLTESTHAQLVFQSHLPLRSGLYFAHAQLVSQSLTPPITGLIFGMPQRVVTDCSCPAGLTEPRATKKRSHIHHAMRVGHPAHMSRQILDTEQEQSFRISKTKTPKHPATSTKK